MSQYITLGFLKYLSQEFPLVKMTAYFYVTLHIHCLQLKRLLEAEGTVALTFSAPQSFLTDIKLPSIRQQEQELGSDSSTTQ